MKTIAKILVLSISVFAAVQVLASAKSQKESAGQRESAQHESPGV